MKVASLFLVVLLAACASQAIPPTYYLLRSDAGQQTSELKTSKQYALGTVEIAAYLDQAGLVLETAEGEVRPASHNLWAEPIFEGVRNYLNTEIAQASGEQLLPANMSVATTVVNIRIDQLHGTLDGQAHIVAYWWLVRAGEVATLERFAESQPLAASGYAALVEAEKALLSELAQRIAASLA